MTLVCSGEHTEAIADEVLRWFCRKVDNRLDRVAEVEEVNDGDTNDCATYIAVRQDAERLAFGSRFKTRLMNRCQDSSARIIDIVTTYGGRIHLFGTLDDRRQGTNQEQEWSSVCLEHQSVSCAIGKQLEQWRCWIWLFSSDLDRSVKRKQRSECQWMRGKGHSHRIGWEQDELVWVRLVVRRSVSETYWNISPDWNLDAHGRMIHWYYSWSAREPCPVHPGNCLVYSVW